MPRHPFIVKTAETIELFRMLRPGEKVIAGVSGGPDSTAMLQALNELKSAYEISLVVCHLHHGLRYEAEAEMMMVRDMAEELGLLFFGKRVDVAAAAKHRNLGVQEAARQVRYEFYEEIRQSQGGHKIAVGHTADDQAEEVLMRLIRGSGPAGLAGIPPVRDGTVVRPIIGSTRAEVLNYLRSLGSTYAEDVSNRNEKYLRARVRARLLPLLKDSFNPDMTATLVRTAGIMAEAHDFLAQEALKRIPELAVPAPHGAGIRLDVPRLLKEHPAIQTEIIRQALKSVKGDLRGLGYVHIQAVRGLLDTSPGEKKLCLPAGVMVIKSYDHLFIRADSGSATQDFAYPAVIPGRVEIPDSGAALSFVVSADRPRDPLPERSNQVVLDYDRLPSPLEVRNFRPGDRISPMGMGGTVKLKKLFIDLKVPRDDRKSLPLLAYGGEILWVPGLRVSDRIKMTSNTTNFIVSRYFPSSTTD
ncbi:MAG: tRNA lysidine(34) synthetase TilS [Deltaproteobacteria bacterium]|nr:tRNA lysidine(34) synthetase TilS [Deltaproteobacteria bacterium]